MLVGHHDRTTLEPDGLPEAPADDARTGARYLVAVVLVAAAYVMIDLPVVAHGAVYVGVELSALVATFAGVRRHGTRDRHIWWSVRGALLLWILGDVVRFGEAAGYASSVPGITDFLSIAGLASFAVASWCVARSRRRMGDPGRMLDTALISLGIGVPVGLLWLGPPMRTAGSAPGPVALVANALLVMVLVVLVVRVVLDGLRGQPRLQWFVAAVVSLSATELVDALQVLGQAYVVGSPLDAGWLLFFGLIGGTALRSGIRDAAHDPAAPRLPSGMLVVALWCMALVSPAILIRQVFLHVHDTRVEALASIGTVVGFTLLALRIWHLLGLVSAHAREEGERADLHAHTASDLRALERTKNVFLSAISHELRTPLTSVRGMSELLTAPDAHRLPADRRKEMLTRIAANARRLEQLLTDLLDLERLQQGVLRPHRARVDATRTVRLAAGNVTSRPVTVPSGTVHGRVDPMMLERIVENLLSNAVKYSPPGTPVTIDVGELPDCGVRVVVADAGAGIAVDDRERIFEAFTRLDGGLSSPGTGVGLSLVAAFARLHGGAATVDTSPAGGARFTVDLPGADPTPVTPCPLDTKD